MKLFLDTIAGPTGHVVDDFGIDWILTRSQCSGADTATHISGDSEIYGMYYPETRQLVLIDDEAAAYMLMVSPALVGRNIKLSAK